VASRPSRLLRPLGLLAVLAGLAACTAGVPETGRVVSVSSVTSAPPPVDPQSLRELGGPTMGQSETDVAVGFMNAMNSGDVSKIQRWVMPGEPRDKLARWSARTATIKVYSAFEPLQEYISQDNKAVVVPIRVKMVGELRGGRDWYPASGDHLLNLELAKDGSEPRVANPGPFMWMRDMSFSRRHTSAEIVLVPELNDPSPRLAPVPVFVPNGDEDDPEASSTPVKAALELLLDGPQDRYANLDTAIPPGTRLREFRLANDLATVDLTRGFADPEGSGQLRVAQVFWTVSRLLPTATVRIMVEGRPVMRLGADQFPAAQHWRPRDEPLAGMWPQRSRERDGDSVLFVRRGELLTIVPEPGQSPQPFGVDAPSPKSVPTWSPDRRWMAFVAESGNDQSLWLVNPGRDASRAEELSGRLSAPTWSPDSKRVYVVSRDETGTRMVEVARGNMVVRPVEFTPLPSGLEPVSIAVSPDGTSMLAVADRPSRGTEDIEPVPGGRLYLGRLGPDGITSWSPRQLAPGLGRIFSPVWVDPVTIAFVAETDNKDDLGKLWTMRSDGWDPTAVLNDTEIAIGDIGNRLAVDPTGRSLIVSARSTNGASLWMVNRQDKSVTYLTFPTPNAFDSDPSFASR
jgi:Sporulation and spore germination/WD40-like Beta Propeller Repeat